MISKNLNEILQKIENSRLQYSPHHVVKLLVVSKYQDENDILEAYRAGQRSFGENKVQNLKQKMEKLSMHPIDFHFIGSLQDNKINQLISLDISLFHSLDSLKLAQNIDKRLKRDDKKLNALLQVNAARDDRTGFIPEMVVESYQQIQQECSNINLLGLMCVGPNSIDFNTIDKSFAITKNLFDKLAKNGASILSMGMSGDYEIAIANGSNLVRIGSKIFDR